VPIFIGRGAPFLNTLGAKIGRFFDCTSQIVELSAPSP
jgi:hypothetical protein